MATACWLTGKCRISAAASEVRIGYTYGVLKLALRDDDYDWEFISIAGVTLDSGTASCHGIAPVEPPAETTL